MRKITPCDHAGEDAHDSKLAERFGFQSPAAPGLPTPADLDGIADRFGFQSPAGAGPPAALDGLELSLERMGFQSPAAYPADLLLGGGDAVACRTHADGLGRSVEAHP